MPVSAKVVHCIPRVVTSLTKLRCDLFPAVGSPVQGPTICWGEHKIFSHVYFYDALKINRLFLVFKSSLHHFFFLLLYQTLPPSNPALEGASAAPERNESPWPMGLSTQHCRHQDSLGPCCFLYNKEVSYDLWSPELWTD